MGIQLVMAKIANKYRLPSTSCNQSDKIPSIAALQLTKINLGLEAPYELLKLEIICLKAFHA
jgi:hypothetical protein